MSLIVLLMSWLCEDAVTGHGSADDTHSYPHDMNIIDEKQLLSLNTSQYLVQFCNVYCEGTEKKQFMPLGFLTTPRCLECDCDSDCGIYGDCCPRPDGSIAREPHPPSCLSSDNDLDIHSKANFGIFMVTGCESDILDDVFYPVFSPSKNISYFNEEVAKCNEIQDFRPWIEELDCTSGDYSGENEAARLPGADPDSEEDCRYVYSATRNSNPRACDPMFTVASIIRTCNVSGTWNDYDETTEAACHGHIYHVAYGSAVYGNIFCAMCNGVRPTRIPMAPQTHHISLPPPITVITQFFKRHTRKSQPVKCTDDEWLDITKDSCLPLFCAPGKVRMDDEDCAWSDMDAIGDEYTFSILLSPDDSLTQQALSHWNSVQQMFIENFERFMKPFYTSNYMISVGLIEDRTILNDIYGPGDIPRAAVYIDCSLVITRSAKRELLETKLYEFVSKKWVVRFDDNDHLFSPMFNAIPLSRVRLKAKYWSDPVSGRCCSPVADGFHLRNANGSRTERVIPVTNELFCLHVKLPRSRHETEKHGWITLTDFNVSISADDFSLDDRNRARICVAVLNDIHNGTYYTHTRTTGVPSFVLAQQILSVTCVTLSLVCLALTLMTYSIFPALRSLPAKNNMFLMGSLFLAQFLFQFNLSRTENHVVCQITGVFIHFLWLSVAFWMNVCSFHMFRVFAVRKTMPCNRSKHTRSLLKYCLYAFGSSACVVATTIIVSLVLSNGSDIGYGGNACYLNSNQLVGLAFVLPLCILLVTNLAFFVVTVRAISKIEQVEKHGMKEQHNVYVYIKLSSLTGIFWIVAILSEVFQEEFLVYVSIIVNGSLGVLLFACYTINRRVYDLWKGTVDRIRPKPPAEESRNATVSTSV